MVFQFNLKVKDEPIEVPYASPVHAQTSTDMQSTVKSESFDWAALENAVKEEVGSGELDSDEFESLTDDEGDDGNRPGSFWHGITPKKW